MVFQRQIKHFHHQMDRGLCFQWVRKFWSKRSTQPYQRSQQDCEAQRQDVDCVMIPLFYQSPSVLFLQCPPAGGSPRISPAQRFFLLRGSFYRDIWCIEVQWKYSRKYLSVQLPAVFKPPGWPKEIQHPDEPCTVVRIGPSKCHHVVVIVILWDVLVFCFHFWQWTQHALILSVQSLLK